MLRRCKLRGVGFVRGSLVVEQLDATFWRLREPVVYQGARETFEVPAGFRTDFASVPRLVVWLLPRYGVYTRAAILHDYLVENAAVSRADADGLFRRSMRELGVSAPRRWMMWAAVRAASGMAGASASEWLAFLLVAPPALLFVAVPAVTVQVFLVLFWVVELVAWALRRVRGRPSPPPRPDVLAA